MEQERGAQKPFATHRPGRAATHHSRTSSSLPASVDMVGRCPEEEYSWPSSEQRGRRGSLVAAKDASAPGSITERPKQRRTESAPISARMREDVEEPASEPVGERPVSPVRAVRAMRYVDESDIAPPPNAKKADSSRDAADATDATEHASDRMLTPRLMSPRPALWRPMAPPTRDPTPGGRPRSSPWKLPLAGMGASPMQPEPASPMPTLPRDERALTCCKAPNTQRQRVWTEHTVTSKKRGEPERVVKSFESQQASCRVRERSSKRRRANKK